MKKNKVEKLQEEELKELEVKETKEPEEKEPQELESKELKEVVDKEIKDPEEKEPQEHEDKETEHTEDVFVNEEVSKEQGSEELTASDLIQQQARQTEYVEKMNALLNKDDISIEDIKNIEYIKSELLSQLVGVMAFSSQMAVDDPRIKAADTLSSHLTKMYTQTALLREKMEKRRLAQLEKMDVADAYFGPTGSRNANQVVTDSMLMPDVKKVIMTLKNTNPAIVGALALADFIKDPETRLNAMKNDLLNEFKLKTSGAEKQNFSQWAETLISGLAEMNTKGAMQNALNGNRLSNKILSLASSNANDVLG